MLAHDCSRRELCRDPYGGELIVLGINGGDVRAGTQGAHVVLFADDLSIASD